MVKCGVTSALASVLFICLPSSAQCESMTLVGTLGARERVQMSLQREGTKLSGDYFYLRYRKPLKLTGTVDSAGNATLQEVDAAGAVTGVFRGRLAPEGTFDGAWSRPDGAKAMPFKLRPAQPPPFAQVKKVLCQEYKLQGAACQAAAFRSEPVDLDSDGHQEWVYVNLKGPELCHVRNACFTIMQRGPAGWRAVLHGLGEEINFTAKKHGAYLDLVVIGGESASESYVSEHVWKGTAYRRVRSKLCPNEAKSSLCASALKPGGIILE